MDGYISFIFKKFIDLFMVVAMSGLFLVARSGGYPLVTVHKLLIKPLQSKGCRHIGFSSCRTRAQPWWHTGLVALRMCSLPKPGIKPRVLCIGRWILIHWTTREVLPTLRQSPIWLSSSHPQQPPIPVPIYFPPSVRNNSF